MSMHKKLIRSLHFIINEVKNLDECQTGQVSEIIKSSGIKAKDLLPYANFDHSPEISYGRNIIFENPQMIILTVSWAPGDFTAIHSHGKTEWGAVCFMGNTEHRLYKAESESIHLTRKEIIPAGSIVDISGDYTHAMGNLTNKAFQTLHIYGTNSSNNIPGDGAMVYLPEKNLICRTGGSAFLNINEEHCQSRTYGISTNYETILDYFNSIRPYYKRIKHRKIIKLIDQVLLDPESYFRQLHVKHLEMESANE